MTIEVVHIGQRLVRDDRVTTHVALVARAFGAKKIYMRGVNPDIKDTIKKINDKWGGDFQVEFIENLRRLIKEKKEKFKIVHLTMYGESINDLRLDKDNLLIIIGAEKVPREIYDLADWNVSIGNQPHSEISALAILLDRINDGKITKFTNAKYKIIPTKRGKKVINNELIKENN